MLVLGEFLSPLYLLLLVATAGAAKLEDAGEGVDPLQELGQAETSIFQTRKLSLLV